jgi:hypothetical protein
MLKPANTVVVIVSTNADNPGEDQTNDKMANSKRLQLFAGGTKGKNANRCIDDASGIYGASSLGRWGTHK